MIKLGYFAAIGTMILCVAYGLDAAPCTGDYDIYGGGSDTNTWTKMTVKQTGWNYAHFLILRSEITTCEPSVINAISFYRTRRDDCETDWPATEVWLRETTSTSLSANEDPPPSRATHVYTGTWRQTLSGWQEIRFNVTDFSWGSGNLEIWVKEENSDTGGYSPYYSTTLKGNMQEGYGYSGYYIDTTYRFDSRLTFTGGTPGPTNTPTTAVTDTPTPTPTGPTPTPEPVPFHGIAGTCIVFVILTILCGGSAGVRTTFYLHRF